MTLKFLSPIHRAVRQITLYLESPLGQLGVRPGESHLLGYLEVYGPCPVGELVRVFGWKKSTLTSLLDRLEQRGILGRRLNPEDRRSLLVELSPVGHQLARRVREPVEELESLIRQQIGEADLAGFRRVMAAIDAVTAVEVRPERQKVGKETA